MGNFSLIYSFNPFLYGGLFSGVQCMAMSTENAMKLITKNIFILTRGFVKQDFSIYCSASC